jgi:predicted permease
MGTLGLFALGGAGVHMSSLASAFFYKYITAADPENSLAASITFACSFSLPLYIAFFVFWLIHTYAHIRAIAGAFSPYPRWCWVFSMPVGALLFSLVNVFGNYAIVNAIMVGALTLGNIWALGGSLLMLDKAKENHEKNPLFNFSNGKRIKP